MEMVISCYGNHEDNLLQNKICCAEKGRSSKWLHVFSVNHPIDSYSEVPIMSNGIHECHGALF